MLKDGPGLNLGSLMIAHDTHCEARMRGAVSPHRPGKSYFARNRIGLTNIKLNGSPGGADRAPSRRHDYRDMRSRGWAGASAFMSDVSASATGTLVTTQLPKAMLFAML